MRSARLALGAGLAALLTAACERVRAPAAPPPPRVLFVTWDTVRADRLGAHGGTARTPTFDSIAARGVLYERVYACAPLTLPSHTAMLSGVYPCAHGVRNNATFEVGSDARLIAEVFRDAGWRTGAFVAAFILDSRYGLNQGFEIYDAPDTAASAAKWGVVERPAGATADAALRFIDTLGRDEPFFLWVHFYDPHLPRDPPKDLLRDGIDPYDAEIAACDRETRRILDRLRARGLDDGLVTLITSDHGDSFGEHDEKTHGVFVYDSTMRVPLVIAPPPAGTPAGTRIRAPVSNVDVAATLLERAGLGRAHLPDARTPILPASDDEVDPDRPIYLESYASFYTRRWAPLRALVWRDHKFVDAPRPELYSLKDDPRELDNRIDREPAITRTLAARLRSLLEEHPPLGWERGASVRQEDVLRLAQLGYVAGGGTDGEPTEGLPDPKDRVGEIDLRDQLVSRMREATALLGLDGAPPPALTPEELRARQARGLELVHEAKGLLERVRTLNPHDLLVPWMAPTIELGLGNWDAAARGLEELIALDPRAASNHHNLANAYVRLGRVEWANREMEKAVFLDPHALYSKRWLVEMALSRRDWSAAAWWLDEMAKWPGATDADRAELAKARERVQRQLDLVNAKPRPPAPIRDDELESERALAERRRGR